MIANFVTFQLIPGAQDAFIEASLANSRGSIDGPGCVATSIFADPNDDCVAYVFEVFVDQEAFEHHHDQPYYQRWIETTKPLMAAPYELTQSTTFPTETSFTRLREAVEVSRPSDQPPRAGRHNDTKAVQ